MKISLNGQFEKGLFWMLLSGVCLSFFSLFAKLGSEALPFFFLTFLRFIVPLIIIFPYIARKIDLRNIFKTPHLRLHLIRIFFVLIYQYSIFYYLTKRSLLDATILQNTSPLFIPLFDYFVLRHRISRSTLVSILIAFFGVLFVLDPGRGLLETLSLIGLAAAISQAGSQFVYGLQSRRESSEISLFYLYFFCSIFSFVIFCLIALVGGSFVMHFKALTTVDPSFYFYLITLSFFSIFNQTTRGLAYRYGRPSTLAPFLYFSVIFSGVLDWLIFHHLPTWASIFGGGLILSGGLIQYFAKRTRVDDGS